MAKFQSTKTYGTDRGLSTCFRQWRANHSHCSTLHGYSLGFKFIFESETLDEKNWCFDFGGMKPIKQYLDYMFDHTVLVAEDDPALPMFQTLAAYSTNPEYDGLSHLEALAQKAPTSIYQTPYQQSRVCDLRVVPGVGCEMTAKMVYEKTVALIDEMKAGKLGRYAIHPDVRLVSVECFEHGSNSALYVGDEPKAKVAEKAPERKVFTVELEGKPEPEVVEELISNIKAAVKEKKTVDSDLVKTMVNELQPDMKDVGNLQPFGWELAELHRLPPVDEK